MIRHSFQKSLMEQRLKKEWTQEELATFIHSTPQCISNYEQGDREPNFEKLMKLCEAFDCGVIIRKGGDFQFIDSKRLPPAILTPEVHTQLLMTQLRELEWEAGEVTYNLVIKNLAKKTFEKMGYKRNIEGHRYRGIEENLLFPEMYQALFTLPGGSSCQTYSSELAMTIREAFKDYLIDTLEVVDGLSLTAQLKTRVQLIFGNEAAVYQVQQQILSQLLDEWEKNPEQSLYNFNLKLHGVLSLSMHNFSVIDFSAQSVLPESKTN